MLGFFEIKIFYLKIATLVMQLKKKFIVENNAIFKKNIFFLKKPRITSLINFKLNGIFKCYQIYCFFR